VYYVIPVLMYGSEAWSVTRICDSMILTRDYNSIDKYLTKPVSKILK